MSDIDFNALGQAIDSTFGRSSTPKTASYSVKMTLQGAERLLVSYAAIVNFATERQMIDVKRAYVEEATTVVANTIKRVKAIYKDLTGKNLKIKIIPDSESDSVEIINFNVHNARRTAYYRRKVIFEIG